MSLPPRHTDISFFLALPARRLLHRGYYKAEISLRVLSIFSTREVNSKKKAKYLKLIILRAQFALNSFNSACFSEIHIFS